MLRGLWQAHTQDAEPREGGCTRRPEPPPGRAPFCERKPQVHAHFSALCFFTNSVSHRFKKKKSEKPNTCFYHLNARSDAEQARACRWPGTSGQDTKGNEMASRAVTCPLPLLSSIPCKHAKSESNWASKKRKNRDGESKLSTEHEANGSRMAPSWAGLCLSQ